MKLKPKSTTKNPKALLYKRFIGLEKSFNLSIIYRTIDGKNWGYDNETLKFFEIENEEIPETSRIVNVETSSRLKYQDKCYRYSGVWALSNETPTLNLTFNNIGKYQTNKYYYVGCFDFVIKGSIEGTTTQYIKGNIIPLTSLNIKYYDDDITVTVDDLVVVDGHLYSVENPETSIKQQPKPFKIHFATLNNIL